ncbi:hypothetical protein MASR2M36_37340 [Providencia sp.]
MVSKKFIYGQSMRRARFSSTGKKVIDTVRKMRNIPVVFSESTISDKPARQVSKETGATCGVLYVDLISTADGPVHLY